ncbi:AAA family ATPase [Vagococcus sp. PNs007]|uniref:AAA family ATPase n=1 Tax=Vagococcus proximus TaxID=2991417 RepID=A0ABT5X4E2_9ENTE|nr:AAA family ATPase [Vagococcus proximus]MDF0480799.1 AAA family ATPase [Vagococcus proximus]
MQKIIWINGTFGSGKTTLATQLKADIKKSFLFDPETIGGILSTIIPKNFQTGNFQDLPSWRFLTYHVLATLNKFYKGTIIVPMTLCNKDYYEEIIGKMIHQTIPVEHYILIASTETIENRLKKREREEQSDETFARQMMADCVKALSHDIPGIKIETDTLTTTDISKFILNHQVKTKRV